MKGRKYKKILRYDMEERVTGEETRKIDLGVKGREIRGKRL